MVQGGSFNSLVLPEEEYGLFRELKASCNIAFVKFVANTASAPRYALSGSSGPPEEANIFQLIAWIGMLLQKKKKK